MPATPPSIFTRLPSSGAWLRFFHQAISAVWFERVTVRGGIPDEGPVLLVSRHRNGAVDGFLLHAVHPRVQFMVAARLMRHRWQRIFFGGIPVERAKDHARPHDNAPALEQCLDQLLQGGALAVFPEGTSTLGPQPLPFHSGAARLACAFREKSGVPLTVIPVGLHYDEPGTFRSRVEVHVGEPLRLDDQGAGRHPLHAARKAIDQALRDVGANFPDEAHQQIAEAAAPFLPGSRWDRLKHWEAPLPASLHEAWRACGLHARHLAAHAPRCPAAIAPLLLLTPLALPGVLLNVPVILAAALASRRLADGPNVIALWKILAGSAVALLWLPALALACLCLGGWQILSGYVAATLLSALLWRPVRNAVRACHLLLATPATRQSVHQLRTLFQSHDHDSSRTSTPRYPGDESSPHRRQGLTSGQSHP